MVKTLIALGGNMPFQTQEPQTFIPNVIARLEAALGAPSKQSRLYKNPPYPKDAGGDFVNAVIAIECALSAERLLALLHEIERDYGRTRTCRWGARTLDLDILAYGEEILPDEQTVWEWMRMGKAEQQKRTPQGLILPHPRLAERAFVVVPLAEIAPDWRHPLLQKSARELCAALCDSERAEMRPLTC